ncbi:hypothetical protein IGJ02_000342 [Enterococcus sp. DIV0724b]|uniref:lectin-like domain-containing protein n=1 Tax=Enterococcus sp. DIV0724b TaxID=2774694 RepID=UPI003D2FD9FE
MKQIKKRRYLLLIGIIAVFTFVYINTQSGISANEKEVVKKTNTAPIADKTSLLRANTGIDNPPEHVFLDGIFQLPAISDSTLIGNVVQVTDNKINQEGAIWSTSNNLLDLTKDFELEAYLYFGNKKKDNGDGMTFAMHNDPERLTTKRGIMGEHLGVYGKYDPKTKKHAVGALENSFAVEFDTYYNEKGMDAYLSYFSYFDRAHIAYAFPGREDSYGERYTWQSSLNHQSTQVYNSLANDQWNKFTVFWDSKKQTLTYQYGSSPQVAVPIDPQVIFGTNDVIWGFTGSTGGSTQYSRVVFTKVPGLVNAKSTITAVDSTGNPIEGKSLKARQKVTYTAEVTYESGKQDWFDVSGVANLNEFVDYVPGSLKLDGIPIDDTSFIESKRIALGDLSLTSTTRKISFEAQTKELTATQNVSDTISFAGKNYMSNPETFNYQITASTVKDSLAIDPIAPLNKSTDITGNWSLKNLRKLKSLIYQVDDGATILLPKETYATNDEEFNPWKLQLSQELIDSLDVTKEHVLTVTGIPEQPLSGQPEIQATAKFAVKPQQVTLDTAITDKATSIEGIGVPGLTIQLRDEQDKLIKETTVDPEGKFVLSPLVRMKEGTKVNLIQKSQFAISEPLEATVEHLELAPKLVVEGDGETTTILNGADFTIKTQVSGEEADDLMLKYAINGAVNDSMTEIIANPTINEVHTRTATLKAETLPIGEYSLTVVAEWKTSGMKSTVGKINLLVVAGTMTFSKVPEEVSFEQGAITNQPQTLARKAGWDIQIEDFRGKGSKTTLYAKLTGDFKTKENHIITNSLIYVNQNNQATPIPVDSSVKVFERETTETFANVAVDWQANQGILFDLKPGNYSGTYQGEIEWTLLDIPKE